MRSPTFTGRYVKTVPASVRCTPSTRMSLMTNGSIAKTELAASNRARKASRIARASDARGRFKDSAREQAIDVVVEREERESEQERETETLSDFHRALRDGTSLHDFGEIIHQVPPGEARDG